MKLGHASLVYLEWKALQQLLRSRTKIPVNGHSLSLAQVIAICLYGAKPCLTEDEGVLKAVNDSVDILNQEIQLGKTIYGVNTGFGGSADVRTCELKTLQSGLVQHLNVGILLPSDTDTDSPEGANICVQNLKSHAIPLPVVRGMALIRCNTLLRGHSGVRIKVIQTLLELLQREATPVIPLRGSISASGDLCPLSYLAGMLTGNPGIWVRLAGPGPAILTADKALEALGIEPVSLQAKEALGITNGTATSTAAASIAMHQAHQLAVLVQLLTAMATEALRGTLQNYHPFISTCRPHSGQSEAANNILSFLSGSKLAKEKDAERGHLAQDRYGLRTAPQWIGPLLENLMLAHRQVEIEINSTTDNPLVDVSSGKVYHGGNFQAASITCAMEKVTSSMQLMGKLMFAQCSELLNCTLSNHLPPNLAPDDPSTSFTMKGFDINMAAYMSELAYLANPISTHVQSAEMNNQSVNSLAFISARIALDAVEVTSLMAATYLCALCQALDLCCLHIEFEKAADSAVGEVAMECFGPLTSTHAAASIHAQSWGGLLHKWLSLATLDLNDRGRAAVRETTGSLLELLSHHCQHQRGNTEQAIDAVAKYSARAGEMLCQEYDKTRSKFLRKPTTSTYLSESSKLMYDFVRNDLGVQMHCGLACHATIASSQQRLCGNRRQTLGTMASAIYVALRNGKLNDRVMQALSCVGEHDIISTGLELQSKL